MVVKRIVTDIGSANVEATKAFYMKVFDLDLAMDLGWIATLSTDTPGPAQISIMSEGGSGAPIPDMSIEVENVDQVLAKAQNHNAEIIYPLTDEPWGVRRFFLRDPAGKIINVLSHK